jgi:hypothetical protein
MPAPERDSSSVGRAYWPIVGHVGGPQPTGVRIALLIRVEPVVAPTGSKYGPLLSLYSTQQIGNALGWGLVDDTPNAFVWEIGAHTANFSTPGQTDCDSYNAVSWLGITPLKILSVTFANGSAPSEWAGTKSDYKQGSQDPATMQCGGPYGPDSTYCVTVLKPSPL